MLEPTAVTTGTAVFTMAIRQPTTMGLGSTVGRIHRGRRRLFTHGVGEDLPGTEPTDTISLPTQCMRPHRFGSQTI